MSFAEVGKGFIGSYYPVFSNNRADVAAFYRPESLLTWSGKQMQGVAAIMDNHKELTFTKVQFNPEDIDCHPSVSGGVLIVVNGACMLDDERHALKFNDVFHLACDPAGHWFVTNQIFRIIGGS
eukprot:Tbor_TRINITY_DN2654_c1_g2::TRINITY_DN2654_c1_g2_i1::g.17998::m.17998